MKARVLLAAIMVVVWAVALDCEATTWYVNEEGTGDAPTIQAAMDSVAYGDTVLVGPGTYQGGIAMADGVVLRSEEGPCATTLTTFGVHFYGYGVSGTLEGFTITGVGSRAVTCDSGSDVRITRNLIVGNGPGVYWFNCDGEISANTIVGNEGEGIFLDMAFPEICNNVIASNWGGIITTVRFPRRTPGVDALDHHSLVGNGGKSRWWIECNDVWGNGVDYDWEDDFEAYGNFSEDPLFCDPDNGDYSLEAGSPCLPGHHPNGFECGLIGAFGRGCGPSAVAPRSWSQIKALYR